LRFDFSGHRFEFDDIRTEQRKMNGTATGRLVQTPEDDTFRAGKFAGFVSPAGDDFLAGCCFENPLWIELDIDITSQPVPRA
jgi:hypothetical protein